MWERAKPSSRFVDELLQLAAALTAHWPGKPPDYSVTPASQATKKREGGIFSNCFFIRLYLQTHKKISVVAFDLFAILFFRAV